MSKITLADLIRQWRTPGKKLPERLTPADKISLVKKTPSSLEAKIAVSPYGTYIYPILFSWTCKP